LPGKVNDWKKFRKSIFFLSGKKESHHYGTTPEAEILLRGRRTASTNINLPQQCLSLRKPSCQTGKLAAR
jgi:hypothetical protein